jgi:ribosomal protein S18 acetylase RimI-like enzyme
MAPFVSHGGELHLSNLGQLSLLQGMAERGASLRTSVRGFSMTPFIQDQDVVTIAPMNGRPPRVGEVVAFSHPDCDRLAIHRVVACTERGWIVRGDNCPEADGVVGIERVHGRVVAVERGGKPVRVGLGMSGRLIAALNRGTLLGRCNMLLHLPRRAAGFTFRHAQGLATFRAVGRRVAPGFEIAVASEADCETVHRQHNPLMPYLRSPPDPQVTNWVAKVGPRIVGFVQLTTRSEEGSGWRGHWLLSLSVQSRYRGLGIGDALTQVVVDRSVADGAPDLRLAVYEDNFRAIGLYEKMGFERITVPVLEPVFLGEKAARGRRRIVMQKRLGRDG